MYLNRFSVRVSPGKELESGYVALVHNTQYTLHLKNDRDEPCDAEVVVDGKSVGTFRVYAHQSFALERPSGDKGKFTFYKLGTPEASQAQLSDNDNLGLISVTFKPAKKFMGVLYTQPQPVVTYGHYRTRVQTNQWTYSGTATVSASAELGSVSMDSAESDSVPMAGLSSSYSAGGTGLSGQSNQSFSSVTALDYDPEQFTTINLRLVASADGPRPLTQVANPIPPRIR